MNTLKCFFHLKMTFILYSSLLLVLFSHFPEKGVALQSHFETVESAPKCKHFFTDPKKMPKSTFEVFDIYGPCSPAGAGTSPMKMPSPHDILHLDQIRVNALQDRFKINSTTNKYNSQFQDTKVVAHLPVQFSDGNHAISIGLGTPPQIQNLIFDTGSDITWSNGLHCYASDSIHIISCDNPSCIWLLPLHTCEKFEYFEHTCFYNITYTGGTNSKGALIMDFLTIPQTGDMFQFIFGCATEVINHQLELNVNGILSLSKDPISFVSQTVELYKGIFSYCFPSSPTSTGFLKLGPRDYPDNVRFTHLIANPDYPSSYFINIISISVGHVELSINLHDLRFPGTIIDTTTVVSRLPLNVYITMRNEFRNQMANYGYQSATSPHHFFDTCYYNIEEYLIPIITFTFEGDVSVDMDSTATLYTFVDSQISCLAFTVNSNGGLVSIFGVIQQKKLEVVYDVARGILGFSPNGCD